MPDKKKIHVVVLINLTFGTSQTMGSSLCNLFVDPELILPAKFHLWFDIANFSVDCRGEWHLCITLLAVCYKCTNRLKLQLTSLETAERLWRQIMYHMNNIIGKSTKFNGRHFLIFIKTKFMLYIYIMHIVQLNRKIKVILKTVEGVIVWKGNRICIILFKND